jgi:hypothetical protein
MAIPVKFQQFKSAGIYRLVYDKSIIAGVEAELLRLVVGYSPKGPFNTPVYIKTVSEFTAMFGGISKTLEKRGCFFHRTCIQALEAGPILCLNLKKFSNETVGALDICSNSDPTEQVFYNSTKKVRDIYDTSRFWKLEPEKLQADNALISMCATDSIETTGTVFIRKAPNSKVKSYKMTLEDWYKSYNQEMPDYISESPELQKTYLSDLFTEIYVFSGKFDESVLSTSLAKYFQKEVTEVLVSSEVELQAALSDPSIEHIVLDTDIKLSDKPVGEGENLYRGGLIINKGGKKTIDLNGHTITAGIATRPEENTQTRTKSTTQEKVKPYYSIGLFIDNTNVTIKGNGKIKTQDAYYSIAVWAKNSSTVTIEDGTFENAGDGCELIYTQGKDATVIIKGGTFNATTKKGIEEGTKNYRTALNGLDITPGSIYALGGKYLGFNPCNNLSEKDQVNYVTAGNGNVYNLQTATLRYDGGEDINILEATAPIGPKVEFGTESVEQFGNKYFEVIAKYELLTNTDNVEPVTRTITYADVKSEDETPGIYVKDFIKNAFDEEIDGLDALFNDSASGALAHYVGCVLPDFVDPNLGYVSIDILFNSQSDIHKMMMNINTEMLTAEYPGETRFATLYDFISNSGALTDSTANKAPYTLRGYEYKEFAKPTNSTVSSKLDWQNNVLNVLIEEQGLRKALLSAAEIEYRYIVDSFETYPAFGSEIKSQLSLLAKEKELCFAILNFPSVRVMSSFGQMQNSKGVFDVNKVVDFITLPTEVNGASFCAFYTPLKFSDGYIDTIAPSAALVSNLFMYKQQNRQPYSIVAGPNYANIKYSQLVGPDYHYSQEELHVIEPFGVNCMIYRPTFGTFINANQTAKQTPKTALSAINVRELVIYLQEAIGKVLQSYQWEFNNVNTRNAIKTQADLICENAKLNGGIQAYVNVIDESNNTPDLIDNEFCVLSTSIEPGRGCGKMVHELTIYKTGGLSAIIKEG